MNKMTPLPACKSRERCFRVYEEAPGFRPGPRVQVAVAVAAAVVV